MAHQKHSTALQEKPGADRLRSLDFFRGLTMFLLIVEFTHLFQVLVAEELEGSAVHFMATTLGLWYLCYFLYRKRIFIKI